MNLVTSVTIKLFWILLQLMHVENAWNGCTFIDMFSRYYSFGKVKVLMVSLLHEPIIKGS
jgi:hypothetical protein